jgi:hypothetical protein
MNRRGSLTKQEPLANRDAWGRWILPALAASIVLHLLLWNWSRHVPVQRAGADFEGEPVPHAFQVERVEIDSKLVEPERDEPPQVAISPVRLPEESFSAASVVPETKNPPRLDSAILSGKPVLGDPMPAGPPAAATLPLAADASLGDMLREMPALKNDSMAGLPQPLPASSGATSPAARTGNGKGFTNLDELLAKTGPLTPDTAPILLPGDLLFEYDAYRLQPGAISSMQKLGQLLLRNPRSRFLSKAIATHSAPTITISA